MVSSRVQSKRYYARKDWEMNEKINELIDELEKLVESGNTVPFSSKSLIPPDDALEIIDGATRSGIKSACMY